MWKMKPHGFSSLEAFRKWFHSALFKLIILTGHAEAPQVGREAAIGEPFWENSISKYSGISLLVIHFKLPAPQSKCRVARSKRIWVILFLVQMFKDRNIFFFKIRTNNSKYSRWNAALRVTNESQWLFLFCFIIFHDNSEAPMACIRIYSVYT